MFRVSRVIWDSPLTKSLSHGQYDIAYPAGSQFALRVYGCLDPGDWIKPQIS